ncbi:MAG: asparagine synthase (glutamine-hydrolyzing) [Sarcina sp.]
MCGFLALFKEKVSIEDINNLKNGAKAIVHRGPNDTKEFIDEKSVFMFNRLSIIALEDGIQPYVYEDRFTIVFNGEIYNYKELKEELMLRGVDFITNSEVEVISRLYEVYGDKLINKLRGMFAIVIYDKLKNKVLAFRDYFGIKPLFYMKMNGGIYFASELKALWKINKKLTYRKNLLGEYGTFQYIPFNDKTIFEEVNMVKQGHAIEFYIGGELNTYKYFNVNFKEEKNNKENLKAEIKNVIKESVKLHLESDVPVATFLSGGIDSSIITKIASEINPNIVSYTIGFNVEGYDETSNAKRFANDIGIKNIDIKLNYRDYIRDLPKIIYNLDSPIADPSIVPLYYICKEVGSKYKVVLSGEGSDEFFGGYNIYTEDKSLKVFKYIPKFLKKCMKKMVNMLPDNLKGKSFILRGTTPIEERYCGNARIFNENEILNIFKSSGVEGDSLKVTKELFKDVANFDNVTKRQYIDINTWLVGDILTKADRMSMAHSLEVRVPFVDKEVFKVASKLTKDNKIKDFQTKYMLREAFKDELPEYLYEKKKLGYPVPIRIWLKNELYDWAYDLILNNPVKEINEKEVLKILEKHKAGNGDYSRKIWSIIVYIVWYKIYVDKSLDKDYQFEIQETIEYSTTAVAQ